MITFISKYCRNVVMATALFALCSSLFTMTSCSDMLDVESSRQVENPSMDQKSDSVFYAQGIMQAMQQLADQYYFQNEMRGDLVKPTTKATTHLRNLYNFTADASNKYDSVYLYYKVINNCNYYLAHRDSALYTGTQNVSINEFVGVASFRAWAYLQLVRQYGSVPYVTQPVTSVSEINASTEKSSFTQILNDQIDYLQSLCNRYDYDQLSCPTFNKTYVSAGNTNWGAVKQFAPEKCFIPIDIILGDLYLEVGKYEEAAKSYFNYLYSKGFQDNTKISVAYIQQPSFSRLEEMPSDFSAPMYSSLYVGLSSWKNIFTMNYAPGDVISYIPMAVNYTSGPTTDIPTAFGYDYYASSSNYITARRDVLLATPQNRDIMVVPSDAYNNQADNAPYYYCQTKASSAQRNYTYSSFTGGDARKDLIVQGDGADSLCTYVQKPANGNVYLYRNTTVYLHLAEAFNRMGYPNIAFGILKNGMSATLANYVDTCYTETATDPVPQRNYYIDSLAYKNVLCGSVPFLSSANVRIFTNGAVRAFCGIHFHGAGATENMRSTYQFNDVVEAKIKELDEQFSLGLTPGQNVYTYGRNSGNYSKEDYINAVEDLICDEYAMEFAFEGTRYSDLLRMARHKNESGIYGGTFGDEWLAEKLKNNAPGITTRNCYLPFK